MNKIILVWCAPPSRSLVWCAPPLQKPYVVWPPPSSWRIIGRGLFGVTDGNAPELHNVTVMTDISV